MAAELLTLWRAQFAASRTLRVLDTQTANDALRADIWHGVGPRAWLGETAAWTGVLCSRRVPPSLALAAQDWANELARRFVAQTRAHDEHNAPSANASLLVSGWHSPVEQELFRVLRRDCVPLVGVAARSLQNYRLPESWREAVAPGQMLVLSPFENAPRMTSRTALARNRAILGLCSRVVVVGATPGGALHSLLREELRSSQPARIEVFAHAQHDELLAAGASVFGAGAL